MTGYYLDEKLYDYANRQLKYMWQLAEVSRKRTYGIGGLALAGWFLGASRLPPVSEAPSVIPYLLMLALGSSIVHTMSDRLKNADQTQRDTQELFKKLHTGKTHEELVQVYHSALDLQRRYPLANGYQRE